MRKLTLLLALTLSFPVAAQRISTRCQTVDEPISGSPIVMLRLIGCGEGFPDNTLWHLDRADSLSGDLDASFTRRFTGKGAVVYVWDTGVRPDHSEFARPEGTNILGAIDLLRPLGLSPTCTPLPSGPCPGNPALIQFHTHGTAVASLAAGRTTGVAPDARIVSVLAGSSFLNNTPLPDDFIVQGLDRVIAHAWDPSTPPFSTAIINMSTSLLNPNDPMIPVVEEKIRDMIAGVDAEGRRSPAGKRFLFVTIAGNFIPNNAARDVLRGHCDRDKRAVTFPASRGTAIDGLIVVGGITPENRLWDESCTGATVDILAPATGMLGAAITATDHYRSGQPIDESLPPRAANAGTSYAVPYVSGLAALLLEQDPSLTPEQIEATLKRTASHVIDQDEVTGGGLVAIATTLAKGPKRRATAR